MEKLSYPSDIYIYQSKTTDQAMPNMYILKGLANYFVEVRVMPSWWWMMIKLAT
jgi:hypothetical protein